MPLPVRDASSTGRRPNLSLTAPRIGAQTNCKTANAVSNRPTQSDALEIESAERRRTRAGTMGTTRPKPRASITSVIMMNQTDAFRWAWVPSMKADVHHAA